MNILLSNKEGELISVKDMIEVLQKVEDKDKDILIDIEWTYAAIGTIYENQNKIIIGYR